MPTKVIVAPLIAGAASRIAGIEVVWNTNRREVWIGTGAKKVLDQFEDFFRRCFEVELSLNIPYLTARDLMGEGTPEALALEEARPLDLA